MKNQTAYTVLITKEIGADDGERVIRGIATTPRPDRVGDIIVPEGIQFKNPAPLLWMHRHDSPVGTVTFRKPTKDGMEFEASIVKIDEPGALKDRADEAWQSVRHGLVKAVSIGFRPLAFNYLKDGGVKFDETEVIELSLVTIPANADAVITAIKSLSLPAHEGNKQARIAADSSGHPRGPVQLVQRRTRPITITLKGTTK